MKKVLLVMVAFLLYATAGLAQITIDGDMLDWANIQPADQGGAAESLGDQPTGPEFDWQHIYLASDSTYLYVRATIDPSGTFTGGFDNYDNPPVWELWLDNSVEDTVGLDWGWWNLHVNYVIEIAPFVDPDNPQSESTILHYHGLHANSIWPDDFDSVGVAMGAVNDNDNEVEMAIPWSAINVNADVRPMLYAVGDNIWSNEDYIPNDVTAGAVDSYVINYNPYQGSQIVKVNGSGINTPITIDGDMLDWADVDYIDVGGAAEETGDMPTGPEFDIQDVKMTSDTTNIYLQVAIDQSATFSGGWDNYDNAPVYEVDLETDFADTAGLDWGGFWNYATDYIVDLAPATNPDNPQYDLTILHYHGYHDNAIWPDDYDSVGVAHAQVNNDDNIIEISIPRAAVDAGSDIRPMLYFVGNEVWDNEEYFPNDVTKETGTAYVANWNFYQGASVVPITGVRGVYTGVKDAPVHLATSYKLAQNYPNPFNPTTQISYAIPRASHVTLEVFNLLGQKVATLVNTDQAPNQYTVTWNGKDALGQPVSSGMYFYKLNAGHITKVRKMLLVR